MARKPTRPPANLALLGSVVDATLENITGQSINRTSELSRLWSPEPKNRPQVTAYNCPADEIFFGGSAGGGKTDLGIGLALTRHRRSIIFRRIYKSLRPIIDRMTEILGSRDGLNQSSYVWRLPQQRQVEFGAMELESDKTNYQGNPHDLYVFDEAPEFTLSQFLFVSTWARTSVVGQKVQVLLTGNPPTTPEGDWVVQRYAAWLNPQHPNRALPGELRWYASINGNEIECKDGKSFVHEGETIFPRSRTFIPSRVTDNPYYAHSNYISVLQSLPEPLRSQLLYGDFSVHAVEDLWQTIPTRWVQAAQARWQKAPDPRAEMALRSIGVDVAHGGADKTVVAQLFGTWYAPLKVYPGSATPDGESVARIVDQIWDRKARIGVDAVGYGASAFDTMISWKMRPKAINFGAQSRRLDKSRRFKFFNLRAEAYWRFREALDPEHGDDICLPPDREILADLCSVKFQVTRGKIQLEPKEEVRKRIGRSPDSGDTIVLAWYTAVASGYTDEEIERIGADTVEYDKLDAQMIQAMRDSGMDVDALIRAAREAVDGSRGVIDETWGDGRA